MESSQIRSRFLEFFKKRNHSIIPSASLVTSDDTSATNPTLFNTAGMQPLVPYLLGKSHPEGKRLADSQKCLRTIDIDDIGDKTHATFFEMLGNWSLGDYFKKEAITWSYEFLTSKEEGLGLDPKRLYVTVFEGDKNSAKDLESFEIWKSVGIPENRIYFKGPESNWWPAVKGDDKWTGPTGPCSEMFYDITENGLGDLTPEQFEQADNEQKIVEIWNDVFMEFEKKDGVIVGKLAQKNVDTGAGLERLATVLQKVDNIYDTDLLKPLMDLMKNPNALLKNKRIIADHLRAATFMIADGVTPSNTDRGYILRRLIRRAISKNTDKRLPMDRISVFVDTIVKIYQDSYPELASKKDLIKKVIDEEASKFADVLEQGKKDLPKIINSIEQLVSNKIIDAKFDNISNVRTINIAEITDILFKLITSFGLPLDFVLDEINTSMQKIIPTLNGNFDIRTSQFGKHLINELEIKLKEHQSLSRAGAEQKFKGGLADANDPMVVRYHTATHLLHQALHDVLGEKDGDQKGSNITAERLRFDFTGTKLTDEQKKKVEDIVNEKIIAGLPMQNIVLPKAEAEKTGARHFFGEKYGDEISIYYVGDNLESAYSKEFCGGPHVKNTSELAGPEGKWRFKIQKEEAVSQGVRRIKAVLV